MRSTMPSRQVARSGSLTVNGRMAIPGAASAAIASSGVSGVSRRAAYRATSPTNAAAAAPRAQGRRATSRIVAEADRVRGRSAGMRVTAYSRRSPSTPLRDRGPRSSNSKPAPSTASRTERDTSTSPGAASAMTRAAMWTPIPPTFFPLPSTSPVWIPQRISSAASRTVERIASAQAIARAGTSKTARKPSPAVLISRPANRRSSRRTRLSCSSRSFRHSRSPSPVARSVEPTMSVKRRVASDRVAAGILALDRAGARRIAVAFPRTSGLQRGTYWAGSGV